MQDENFRRVYYVRYADDFVVGITGPRRFAQQIKNEVENFLRETLLLDLSRSKTKISHLEKDSIYFLGTYIKKPSLKNKLIVSKVIRSHH